MIRNTLALSLLVLVMGCGKHKPPADTPTDSKPPPTRKAPSAEDEAANLQGTWRVVGIEAGGDKVPDDRVKKINLTYVFDGNKVTVRRPDRPDNQGTFTVDANHTPKRIDLFLPGQGRTKGTYSVGGNTLRLCLAVGGNPADPYPAAIESNARPKTDVLTLQKE